MVEVVIGTGGWAIFKAPGDPLLNYSKIFNFVEVNSTFYKIPTTEICNKWRKKVNSNFLFTVKAHQNLTHKYKLKPIEASFELFNELKKVCKQLNSKIIVLQTSNELLPSNETLKEIDSFFSVVQNSDIRFVWETRGRDWIHGSNSKKFKDLLIKYNIIHCTDYSKEYPIYINSELNYTRIFGYGEGNKYQFDDSEIKELNSRFVQMAQKTEKVIVSFHTQRMIHDAARSQNFNQIGELIGVSGKIGLDSFIDAINEYERFPTTKNDLIINHGWKIYDRTEKKRERMNDVLMKINDKRYNSLDELITEIRNSSLL